MNDPTRLIVVQPTLAKYRVPVWRELASRPEVDLRLWYGDHDVLPNAEPDGFAAELKPIKSWSVAGQEALWHNAQIEAAEATDADAIVLSWGTRYLSLGPALRTAKRRGLGVVLWGHGYSKNETPMRRWMRNRIAKHADALMFYYQPTADAAIESGWPADRVFAAPNAIDQSPITTAREACQAAPADLAAFRVEHGLEGRRVLLYVSRFTPENRLPLLIEAIDKLRQHDPDVLMVMIGGGELLEEIRSDVERRGLQDHFRLLGPIYEESQLAPWFLSSKAFVYPAAIGLSLLHAFGYGLPVVTDDCLAGHNPEIVAFDPDPASPEANGVTYRAGDSDSLAETLGALLNDPDRRALLASGALRTVQQRYNVPAMVDGIVGAVRRAVR